MRKTTPIRKCVGCNERKPKKELIRVVRNKEGQISIDLTGKANGRGVYLCNDVNCFEKVRKSKKLNQAFKTNVSNEVYDKLETEIKNNG